MNSSNLFKEYERLSGLIRTWWDGDLLTAREEDLIQRNRQETWKNYKQLYLPHPFLVSTVEEYGPYTDMYGWDPFFMNAGLLVHGRSDIVRWHILNHLFMIDRYGFVMNGNRTCYLGRSQTPVLSESVRRYFDATFDQDILMRAYPLLKQEFTQFWFGAHKLTPTGLARCYDTIATDCPRPELCHEAEVLDFTPVFDGHVENCNPTQINGALVRYAENLAWMADQLHLLDEANVWREKRAFIAAKINELCWHEELGWYREFDYVRGIQTPYLSLGPLFVLWAGVPSVEQAERMRRELSCFEHEWGLATTDRIYPSPHPEFQWLQTMYPAGWPYFHQIAVEALERYGFHDDARRIAEKWVRLLLKNTQGDNRLWERYNVVDGSIDLPIERQTHSYAFHGWTAASFVSLGTRLIN